MLTYRQLLLKCNREVLNSILLSKTLDGLVRWDKSTESKLEKAWETVKEGYGHVIETMSKKTGKYPKFAIIVELVPKETYHYAGQTETVPPYISVNYYNSSAKQMPENVKFGEEDVDVHHKYLGFGFSPWDEFVDSDVVISLDAVQHIGNINFYEKVAAEILWEQTFYGYREEETKAFAEGLKKQVEGIKSGKIKTKLLRKKKKGEKYDIRVVENLLASTAKKRSNKKKK